VRGITSALEDTARDYELRSRGPATLDRYALDKYGNSETSWVFILSLIDRMKKSFF
jgi:hypothetical protein